MWVELGFSTSVSVLSFKDWIVYCWTLVPKTSWTGYLSCSCYLATSDWSRITACLFLYPCLSRLLYLVADGGLDHMVQITTSKELVSVLWHLDCAGFLVRVSSLVFLAAPLASSVWAWPLLHPPAFLPYTCSSSDLSVPPSLPSLHLSSPTTSLYLHFVPLIHLVCIGVQFWVQPSIFEVE